MLGEIGVEFYPDGPDVVASNPGSEEGEWRGPLVFASSSGRAEPLLERRRLEERLGKIGVDFHPDGVDAVTSSQGSSDVAWRKSSARSGWTSTQMIPARPVSELTPPTGEGKGSRSKRHRTHAVLLTVALTSIAAGGLLSDGHA